MFKIGQKHVLVGNLLSFQYHGKFRSGYLHEHVENERGNTVTLAMTDEDRERYEDELHQPMMNAVRHMHPCYRSFKVTEIQHLHVV